MFVNLIVCLRTVNTNALVLKFQYYKLDHIQAINDLFKDVCWFWEIKKLQGGGGAQEVEGLDRGHRSVTEDDTGGGGLDPS